MSEPTSQNDELQAALRESREWKAKALAYQKAAEQLKEKAQTLKERAQLALDSNKDLSVSLRQLRKRSQDLHALAQRLAGDKEELARKLQQAEAENLSLRNNLSAVEQQLALYQRAVEEMNKGTQRDDLLQALRSVMTEPGIEEELTEKLRVSQERNEILEGEKSSLEIELRRVREELEAGTARHRQLASELEEQARKSQADSEVLQSTEQRLQTAHQELEESHKELDDRSQELESTYQQLEETREALEFSRQELEKSREELQEKTRELETHEADTQGLVEELYREAETLRAEIEFLATEKLELEQALDSEREKSRTAPSEDLQAKIAEMQQQITKLEDERSDLEIVNIDLLRQLGETEAELEALKQA